MNLIANKDRDFYWKTENSWLSSRASYWWIKRGGGALLSRIGEPDDQALDTQVVFGIPAIGIWVRIPTQERAPFLTTQINLAASIQQGETEEGLDPWVPLPIVQMLTRIPLSGPEQWDSKASFLPLRMED